MSVKWAFLKVGNERQRDLTSPRNATLDYLRFLGAAGIIVFHMQLPLSSIALSALHMFVIIAVFFGVHKEWSHHLSRLLVPWFAWSLVYAAMKVMQALVLGQPIANEFEIWMLIAGTSIHLWFLTFCALYFLIFPRLSRILPRAAWNALSVIVFISSILVANLFKLETPFSQWVTVLPAALIGHHMAGRQVSLPAVLGVIFVLMVFILLEFDRVATQLLIAVVIVVLGMRFNLRENAVSRFCARVSFGVYLVHPAMMAIVSHFQIEYGLLSYAFVLNMSILATVVLKRVVPTIV